MGIILPIMFVLLGLIVLFRGQYEKSSTLDKPLIMGSVFFQFIANVSIIAFLIIAVYLLVVDLKSVILPVVILFISNEARKKLL